MFLLIRNLAGDALQDLACWICPDVERKQFESILCRSLVRRIANDDVDFDEAQAEARSIFY